MSILARRMNVMQKATTMFVIAALMSFFFVALSAPTARAEDGPGLGGVTGGGQDSGGNNGNWGGGTPGTGGGTPGSGTKPPTPGNGTPGNPAVQTKSETTWDQGRAYRWGCSSVSVNANGEGYIGATKTTRSTVPISNGQNGINLPSKVLGEEVKCHFPASWTETQLNCVVSSTASVTKVFPTRKTIANVSKATAYSSNPTVENCRNSAQWIDISATPDEYGHWSAQGVTISDTCQWRTYTSADPRTGAVPANELRGCYRNNNVNPFYAKGTLTCLGWTNGVHLGGYTFTEDDCQNANTGGNLQCIVGGNTLVDWDGQSYRGTGVQILRNGGDVRMRWDSPTIAGSGLQNIISTRSRLAVTDAPWSNRFSLTNNWFGLQKTGSKQNALKDTSGTPWNGGLQSDWTAQWYQPTTAATKFTPHYGFTANFLKQSVRITGLHPDGSWRTEATTVTVRSDASCVGPTLAVDALKVVNGVS